MHTYQNRQLKHPVTPIKPALNTKPMPTPNTNLLFKVGDAGLEWRNYYNDTPWELFMESVAHSPNSLRSMEEFFEDAKQGSLPSFAWLNPRSETSNVNLNLNLFI